MEKTIPQWGIDYITDWKQRLLLCEWEVSSSLDPTPNQDGSGQTKAVVNWDYPNRRAYITFRDDFSEAEASDADWKQTIIHELLHVRLAALTVIVIDSLIPQLAPAARELVRDVFEREHETFVELMSGVLLEMDNDLNRQAGHKGPGQTD